MSIPRFPALFVLALVVAGLGCSKELSVTAAQFVRVSVIKVRPGAATFTGRIRYALAVGTSTKNQLPEDYPVTVAFALERTEIKGKAVEMTLAAAEGLKIAEGGRKATWEAAVKNKHSRSPSVETTIEASVASADLPSMPCQSHVPITITTRWRARGGNESWKLVGKTEGTTEEQKLTAFVDCVPPPKMATSTAPPATK